MSIYKKLNDARLQLQSMPLEKSGHNKFAGYKYFELGDFMPAMNEIFSKVGLCGVVSYGKDLATLQVFDADTDATISITSPMADANLKGCHPIQNLGAVETYTRRYLWVTLMEIVEHDALDSGEPINQPVKKIESNHPSGKGDLPEPRHVLDVPANDPPTPERIEVLKEVAAEIVDFHTKGMFEDMFVVYDNIDDMSERNALWTILKPNSNVRSKIIEIGNLKKAGK